MNFLSDQERVRLKAQHKEERDRRICYRIKAVLLYDKGWSYQQIKNQRREKNKIEDREAQRDKK